MTVTYDRAADCFVDEFGNRSVPKSKYDREVGELREQLRLSRLTIPEVWPLVLHVFELHGGAHRCFHVVLEDDNYEDRCVRGSLESATELGHLECQALARMLLRMTRSQRGRIAKRVFRERLL